MGKPGRRVLEKYWRGREFMKFSDPEGVVVSGLPAAVFILSFGAPVSL
jgi:hypothetical protein